MVTVSLGRPWVSDQLPESSFSQTRLGFSLKLLKLYEVAFMLLNYKFLFVYAFLMRNLG